MSPAYHLTGGIVYDPTHGIDGQRRDIYMIDGKVIDPDAGFSDHEWTVVDVTDMIIMAGGVDMHTHIGGGKVNIARTLLWEDHDEHRHAGEGELRAGSGLVTPSTFSAGYRYAQMGYTACFEPAVLPANARQAHLEMADTPMVDTGGYALLGNDDFLLTAMTQKADQKTINDYVAWTLQATQCIGIKVVNAGGINAFKFNMRALDVDETHPHYNISPRQIVTTLSRAIHDLAVPHPLHIHGSNLGVPGNINSTLATIDAAGGLPIHLTHVQFHAYGTEGERKFSSAAEELTEAVNANSNVSIDVGQIMFGQTITCSGDSMAQHRHRNAAHPKRWVAMDIECDAGCGVVPFRYKEKSFVNALQWAIGLEIFLSINDPWRIAMTTDHPNGAPFTSYPHLIRLLMDRSFRNEQLSRLHKGAQNSSRLSSMDREYSLYEIAIITRAGPARLLGLSNKGHLGFGADADVVAYRVQDNPEETFEQAALLFKDGEIVVRDGDVFAIPAKRTFTAAPEFDRSIEKQLDDWFDRYLTVQRSNFSISDDEMHNQIGTPTEAVRLGKRSNA